MKKPIYLVMSNSLSKNAPQKDRYPIEAHSKYTKAYEAIDAYNHIALEHNKLRIYTLYTLTLED